MIPATTMQLTLYVLQTLGEVPLYRAELQREESIYSEQLNELYSRIRVTDYESVRIQSNGSPDEKNISMMLQADRLKKRFEEKIEPLKKEIVRATVVTAYINNIPGNSGIALKLYYVQHKKKSDIATKLGLSSFEVSDCISKGEELVADFLTKRNLLY